MTKFRKVAGSHVDTDVGRWEFQGLLVRAQLAQALWQILVTLNVYDRGSRNPTQVSISGEILGRGPKGHVQGSHRSVGGNSQELAVLVPVAKGVDRYSVGKQFWDMW